jgi:hypothetical protein
MTTLQTSLPTTTAQFQLALRAGIERATKSPVNNQNKLNEYTAVALGLNNYNALKPQLESLQPTPLRFESDGMTYINNQLINDNVYQDALTDFYVVTREDEMYWIESYINDGTVTGNNRILSLKDLIRLSSLTDEYILKNHTTNLYLSPTQDTEYFNEQCNAMLIASNLSPVKLSLAQNKPTNRDLAELITTSAVLVKNGNAFVEHSSIDIEQLTFSYINDNGHGIQFEFNLDNDHFTRDGTGTFTLKSEEYGDATLIILSPMNI